MEIWAGSVGPVVPVSGLILITIMQIVMITIILKTKIQTTIIFLV